MKTRVISGAILVALLIVVLLVLPKIFGAVFIGLLAAMAAYELLSATGFLQHPRLLVYTMLVAFLTSLWCHLGREYATALLGILVFVAVLFGEMMREHIKIQFEHIAYCLAAGLLVPYLLTALVRIHAAKTTGNYFVIIPFVLAFLSDTGAYFAGMFFGQHKLAPVISPKKTVEGMFGGIVAAIFGMLLYGLILQLAFGFKVNYLIAIVYGLLGSLTAVLGDLCFSVIKRQTGLKDFSKLIPGHGGVLDRFDSVIFVSPLVEALLLLLPVAVK